MKKKYLTYAGTIAAVILAGMFIGICLSSIPFPFLPAATSIDPVTDTSVDENNMLILTGMTPLPVNAFLFLNVTASSLSSLQDNGTGRTRGASSVVITPGDFGHNRWKGQIDISEFRPAEYTIALELVTVKNNFTIAYTDTVATAHFMLGDEKAGAGSIRKKNPVSWPYIRINPANQKSTAGNLRITGITSLEPGTPLAWGMHSLTGGTENSIQDYGGTTLVTEGTDGINRWAVLPGTDPQKPARYQFSISANPTGHASPAGTISAISEFDIPLIPAILQNTTGTTQGPPEYITIDALPDMRADNVYILTGTTSLPPGEDLLVQVYPASFETGYNFSLDARETSQNRTLSGAAVFGGAIGMTRIVNGSGGDNLWSFRLETYQISGGQYLINVSKDRFDYAANATVYGDLFSSRIFTIMGDRA